MVRQVSSKSDSSYSLTATIGFEATSMSNTTTFAKISIQTFRPLRVVLPLEELTADFHQF